MVTSALVRPPPRSPLALRELPLVRVWCPIKGESLQLPKRVRILLVPAMNLREAGFSSATKTVPPADRPPDAKEVSQAGGDATQLTEFVCFGKYSYFS